MVITSLLALVFQAAFVLSLLYLYLSKKYSFWSCRGVKGPKPLPLIGNIWSRIANPPDCIEWEWMRNYGKVYGLYYGTQPILTVVDHELIKQVLIKDFASFANRRELRTFHKIINQNLFFADSEDWKRVRTITTPSFTTGKLRGMQVLMAQCIDKLDAYFAKVTAGSKVGNFDARQVFSGFTIDVIASTAFATETNSNDDRSAPNPFVVNATALFRFEPLKVMASLILPRRLNTLLGIKSSSPDGPTEFYIQLCRQMVQQRKNSQSKRNDFIQMLMDSFVYESDLTGQNYDKLTATTGKEMQTNPVQTGTGSKKMLNEDEIVAQCFLFFVAGFETTATTLSYCIYELVKNREVQKRLYEEITQVIGSNQCDTSSEQYFDQVVHQIPYLDAVIKETLRKYPPVVRLERRVTVDSYKLNGVPLPKDQVVEIPTIAVHYHPDYYPDPHRFDPQRWMPENKHLLVPYTYLPFGDGPRNCVGMRFAYQEIKLALAQVITKYRFEANSNTPDKFYFQPASPMLSVKEILVSIARR